MMIEIVVSAEKCRIVAGSVVSERQTRHRRLVSLVWANTLSLNLLKRLCIKEKAVWFLPVTVRKPNADDIEIMFFQNTYNAPMGTRARGLPLKQCKMLKMRENHAGFE